MRILLPAILFCLSATGACGAESWSSVRKRFDERVKSGDPVQLVEAIRLLSEHDREAAAKKLVELVLRTTQGEVVAAATAVLSGYKSDGAFKAIKKEANKSTRSKVEKARRLELLGAMLRMKHETVAGTIGKLLSSKDEKERIVVLEALKSRRTADPEILARVGRYLKSSYPFAVRLAATSALAHAAHKDAIPLLLQALETPGRIRAAAAQGLTVLSGTKHGMDVKKWQAWWEKAKKDVAVEAVVVRAADPERVSFGKEEQSEFYDIPTYGRRILFIIDKSGSMKAGGSQRRIDAVKAELLKQIAALEEDVVFGIVFFSDTLSYWGGRNLHAATAKNKKNATSFVRGVHPAGATFTDKVMGDALRLFVEEKYVETIYLLTDGAPFRNGFLDMKKVAADIREANRWKSVEIHTIGCLIGAREGKAPARGRFVEPPKEELVRFLQTVAQENNGNYREVK